MFKIDKPKVMSLKEFKRYELDKMNVYSSINKQLLNYGKCFIQDKDTYRVPLINEIQSYISKYYRSANSKFKSAEKLRKSFSSIHDIKTEHINDVARIDSMKRNSNKAYKPMS